MSHSFAVLPAVFPTEALSTLAAAGPMPLVVALLAAALIGFGVAGHRTP